MIVSVSLILFVWNEYFGTACTSCIPCGPSFVHVLLSPAIRLGSSEPL